MDYAIRVDHLSKKYRRYGSVADAFKEVFHPFRKKYHDEFWALKDVSFEVKKGESVGIIGRNGSGKSTLLQILCGVMQPTEGEVTVKGRVSALLELGAGFHPQFSGRENVYLNGAIMGLTKEEIDARFDDIVDFADIGDFIDQPVKTYSSGMFVRLAFAAAINVNPDILVVDEALAVGDMFFQAKCMDRIKKMVDGGVTLFFVSHDSGAIKSVCSKTLLLDKGKMVDFGTPDRVVEKYFTTKVESQQKVIKVSEPVRAGSGTDARYLNKKEMAFENNPDFKKRASFQRIQNGKASFINIQLLDKFENEIQSVHYEQKVILRMAVEVYEDIDLLALGYHIRDRNGVDVIYSGLLIENKPLVKVKAGEKYLLDWEFKASLQHGKYNIACIMSIPVDINIANIEICDFAPFAVQFEMEKKDGAMLHGFVHWENKLEIQKIGI